MRVANHIELNPAQRRELQRLAKSNTVSVRLARRAQIVLLAAEGLQNVEIAKCVGVGRIQAARPNFAAREKSASK